jgi:hypothetical protein
MSRGVDLLARGLDLTRAAVGYLIPLDPDRLEPMDLPHPGPPPAPPGGTGIRHVARALGTERGARQLDAGGRGIVARMMASRLESTSFRELRSDQVARRRSAAGRTPAKPTRTRQWLYASDRPVAPPPRSMREAVGGCVDCP